MYSFSIFPISALDVEDRVCFLGGEKNIYIIIYCKRYKGEISDFVHGTFDYIQFWFCDLNGEKHRQFLSMKEIKTKLQYRSSFHFSSHPLIHPKKSVFTILHDSMCAHKGEIKTQINRHNVVK